jgi:cation:H+ antiporter
MLINLLALFAGLTVLVFSANKFVTGTASIARNLGVPPLLIGLTIVGLGTSAPEILVSAIASWQGNVGLAIGNALGSNIANIGLILGCTALVSPVAFHSRLLKKELQILLGTSVACYVLAFGGLSRIDGLLMLAGLLIFLWWLVRSARQERMQDQFNIEVQNELPEPLQTNKAWWYFAIGLVGLLLSSRLLVWAAVNIAQSFGVSDLVIGLTIVAFGTSLPELAASITSILKKEDDLAVGNIIGSNMYNLLAVYSLPGIIAPGAVAESVLIRDFPVMLVFTGVLFVLGYGLSKPGNINRWEGLGLLGGYIVYQCVIYQSVTA